jgi:hypothetical protein
VPLGAEPPCGTPIVAVIVTGYPTKTEVVPELVLTRETFTGVLVSSVTGFEVLAA